MWLLSVFIIVFLRQVTDMLLFYHEVYVWSSYYWLIDWLIDSGIFYVTSKVVLWCLFSRGTIPDNLKKYIYGEHSDLDKKQLLALGSRLVLILTSSCFYLLLSPVIPVLCRTPRVCSFFHCPSPCNRWPLHLPFSLRLSFLIIIQLLLSISM